jgi:hypothetical protein
MFSRNTGLFSLMILICCLTLSCSSLLPTKAPSLLLPDLAVSNVHIAMQGIPAEKPNCVAAYAPYEVQATIENRGQVLATNIAIIELSTDYAIQIGELSAGQSMKVSLPASSPNGIYNVSIDPQNLITESNESNNTISYLAPTPTPPALCTPSATPLLNLSTPAPTSESANTNLSVDVLRSGEYRSPDWGVFQLTDGIYYRTPPTLQESPDVYTTRIQEPIFYGDVNTDGLEDALVILNTQNGGTGHFIELAVVLNQNGSAYNISTISLGDRVVVESGKVENGIIVLSMRVHGSNDGLCCPSQFVTWNFALNGNQLMKFP